VTTILVVVGSLVMLIAAIICYCRKRTPTNQVEFVVFANENTTAKETKVDHTGTTNQITMICKEN